MVWTCLYYCLDRHHLYPRGSLCPGCFSVAEYKPHWQDIVFKVKNNNEGNPLVPWNRNQWEARPHSNSYNSGWLSLASGQVTADTLKCFLKGLSFHIHKTFFPRLFKLWTNDTTWSIALEKVLCSRLFYSHPENHSSNVSLSPPFIPRSCGTWATPSLRWHPPCHSRHEVGTHALLYILAVSQGVYSESHIF
jgi:hypothetical protein